MLQDYLPLVDEASLFDTTDITYQICSFEKGGRVLQDQELFTRFKEKARLNDDASCVRRNASFALSSEQVASIFVSILLLYVSKVSFAQ